MARTKKATGTREREDSEKIIGKETIEEFVSGREALMEFAEIETEMNIPITMRLSMMRVAELDHLVKRWKTTRAALACDLLEEIIPLVLQRVYQEKTPEEFNQLEIELCREFIKKRRASKGWKPKE
jgi:hypothetical protein